MTGARNRSHAGRRQRQCIRRIEFQTAKRCPQRAVHRDIGCRKLQVATRRQRRTAITGVRIDHHVTHTGDRKLAEGRGIDLCCREFQRTTCGKGAGQPIAGNVPHAPAPYIAIGNQLHRSRTAYRHMADEIDQVRINRKRASRCCRCEWRTLN